MSIEKKIRESAQEQEKVKALTTLANQARTTKELRRLVRALTDEVDEVRQQLFIALNTQSNEPLKLGVAKNSRKPHVTPVCLWSDWHVDEPVPPEQGHGNEYSPRIADKRFSKLLSQTVDLLAATQKTHKVTELVVWCGGDFFSGMIHPDLTEIVNESPAQASLRIYDMLKAGLTYLADQTKLKVLVRCSWGNHGRLTQKPRVATAASHNLEQIVFQSLARDLDSRFQFDVSNTAYKYLELGDFVIRFNHGDRGLRYQGGVGGLSIPLHKWKSRLDENRVANLNVIGHWHQARNFGHSISNGSMIGNSEYSAPYGNEPPTQLVAFIDGNRDRLGPVFPLYLD